MTNLFLKVLRNATNFLSKFSSKNAKENQRHRLLSFILTRYVSLVKSYEDTFPTAAKFYKTFSSGIKEFKNDGLLLFKVYKKINVDGISSLTRRELEVYYEMPANMIKVAPIILIGTGLPFGAAIFALGCMFPKRTLSYHFWSETQRNEFALIDHRKRLHTYRPIMSCMEAQLKSSECMDLKDQISTILEGLHKGVIPTVEEILECKPLFEKYPYSLQNLGSVHINWLIKLHNLHRGWRRKMRLENFATLIQAMDMAILREGGVEKLTTSELKWASFFRGLNPIDMKNDDILIWLRKWMLISKEIDKTGYSLLLHCPVLLAYSEPTNVSLLKAHFS